ncbi:PAS domain S-box protein [Flavobacterium sp.]|uniref:PAS domain S-box protein n=1 Tax=Flavobacterium sp. TaxID=239 RepID=UPI001B601BC0|nr:PAS domain S-box protein [Flavobacterium sp.]MBP6182740.1 PAS domain S-box protein [Flavobacterium sp.]
MNKLEFNFSEKNFNNLFPFFVLIDSSLIIKGFGKNLAEIYTGLKISDKFPDKFTINRPKIENPTYKEIIENLNQLIIIGLKNGKISLRGQFQMLDDDILFVGSPWYISTDEIAENKLIINDFLLNDSLKDVGKVINSHNNSAKELKRLYETINYQEELHTLSLVASDNDNGVVFTKYNGEIFWCNDAYLKLTGFSIDEVAGKTPLDIGKSVYTDKDELKKMTDSFVNGEPFNVELIHGRKDSDYFWAKIKGQPVFDSNGELIQFFAMIEDVTKKKNADFKLLESEKRLSFLITNLQTGILLEDENRKLLLVNKNFCTMFNFEGEPENLIGMDCSNSVEDSKQFFKNPDLYVERLISILENKEAVYNEELELVDGRVFERSYIPVFRDGVYKGNLRSYVDITIKKKYQESLQNEKEKYSNIIANMNLGLIEVDKNEIITLANNSFCKISGYDLEELIGKEMPVLLMSEESRYLINDKNKLRNKGVVDSYEVQINTKKGQKRHLLISGAPSYNINGNITGSIGIHLDITEQKEQEEELYMLSLIAEKNINAVIICDAKGRIEWANASFINMSGYLKEEIVGQKPGHFLQGEETNKETVDYLKDQISKGLPFNCEIINYSKTGEKYWVSIQGQALYNKNGEIINFFAIEENVTKKKELEQQKEFLLGRLAKKNQELEDYAQIVSHDLKSPLRSIHSLIAWIKEDNDKSFTQQTLQYLSMIEGKVEKMDHLIEGILTYSKIDKEGITQENINIQQIVQNIIDIIHIPKNVNVTINNSLPIIKADYFRMQQLFQNIIGNAVNYVEREIGLVEISSKEFDNYYIFSIKDNGVGIDEKNYQKIFNAFQSFTTSEHSTGLGLSIVKKIIEFYNGDIWIESEIGIGTTFFIKLNK